MFKSGCNLSNTNQWHPKWLQYGDENIDFGIVPPPCESVAGVVFEDADNDGCQADPADGVPGVTVELVACNADGSTTVVSRTTTGPDGSYVFQGNEPGTDDCLLDPTITYQVQISGIPSGYNNSTGAGAGCIGDNDDSPANDGVSECYDPSDDDPDDGDDDEHIDFGITPPDEIFDLGLIKTLQIGQPNPVAVGDLVTFEIQVTNQGMVTADNIEITDYVPACLTLTDANWTSSGSNATIVVSAANGDANMPLVPGQSILVPISFTVDACATGVLTNWAEISDATDENGDPVTDVDSTPDDMQGEKMKMIMILKILVLLNQVYLI